MQQHIKSIEQLTLFIIWEASKICNTTRIDKRLKPINIEISMIEMA